MVTDKIRQFVKRIKQRQCHHYWYLTDYGIASAVEDDYQYWEYTCRKCGKKRIEMNPDDCCGCKHICYDSGGGVHCDLGSADSICMATGRQYWEGMKVKDKYGK